MEPRRHIPVALYRLFSASGDLLYIGQSIIPDWRMSHHRINAPWAQEVALISVCWFPNKAEAMIAEAETIASEKPRHNIAHKKEPRKLAPQIGGRVLRKWLDENGISVAEFAERIGVKREQLVRFINCSVWPRGRHQYAIERATAGAIPTEVWERGGIVPALERSANAERARQLLKEVSQ